MDDFVKQQPDNWGLIDKLSDTFNTNEIDKSTFESLTEDDVKELIPALGIRKKFWQKFGEYKIENAEIILDCDDISLNSSEISDCSNVSLEGSVIPHYKNKATLGMPYVVNPLTISNSTVKHLIEKTDEGKLILASYKAGKTFLRNKLSSLIVRNELKNNKDKRIHKNRFFELAKEINDYFPHEPPSIYYVPYVKDERGKPKAARGKLWSTYIYLRSNYKKLGLIDNEQGILTPEPGCSTSDSNIAEIEEKNLWLKNHFDIGKNETINQYWADTYEYRSKQNLDITTYLNSYPFLKKPTGYIWLELDFLNAYPDKRDIFYNRWPHIARALLLLPAKNNKNSYRDKIIKEYEITSGKLIDADNLSDADLTFLLTLLPLYFSCSNLKSKKPSLKWTPSKIEARQGFLLHVKDTAELELEKRNRQLVYEKYGLTEQPIPIIVGELGKPSGCYANINDIYYKVETPMKAIDVTFKIYHSLNAEYPKEARLVWSFIEKGIYGIPSNENYVAVSTLIADIEKIINGDSVTPN